MIRTKSFIKSLGIMGPAASGIALAINHLGGAEIVAPGETEEIISKLQAMIDLGSAIFAIATGIYGRARATTRVGLKSAKPL